MSGEQKKTADERAADAAAQQQQSQQDAREAGGEAARNLDFANMDLSVEAVEERISPSETNVFDK